jgi:hypothetical protein
MAQTEDPTGVIGLAGEAVAPLGEELRHRLTVEVGERDSLALETALLKAFINGMRTGSSQAAEVEMEQPGIGAGGWRTQIGGVLQPPLELPQIDPWAEKYGGEA